MRRVAEVVGALTLVFAFAGCGALLGSRPSGPTGGTIVVKQNPDGSISVEEAAPWWGPVLASSIAAVAAAAGAVYLNNRPPPGSRPT